MNSIEHALTNLRNVISVLEQRRRDSAMSAVAQIERASCTDRAAFVARQFAEADGLAEALREVNRFLRAAMDVKRAGI